ncbi:VOC family protein [Frankia sp. Cas4]|uniref:VOC family protein n=1 Tax=Frankia sp. Cas4 TaxID=3073927 RepID=UPI002AD3D12F|nr:VOC family protein [Frankia sp. Cas4]
MTAGTAVTCVTFDSDGIASSAAGQTVEVLMDVQLDHVVLWVADPLRSLDFYQRVVGLPPVRADAFRTGEAPFPSVRVSTESIIDLMPRAAAAAVNAVPGAGGTAGHPVNHICLAMGREEFDALRRRLADNAVSVPITMEQSFGARGMAPRAFYFTDPDNNVIEARYYPSSPASDA